MLVILPRNYRLCHAFLQLPTKTKGLTLTKLGFSTTASSNELDKNKKNVSIPEWNSRSKCWRPTISDVERISWGKSAKKKGTGSRGVPHRLNHEEERFAFDQGRRKGFLEVVGSGWRSTRSDAPLLNSYRSLCDARGQACIVMHKGSTGMDEIVLDVSPLRLPNDFTRLKLEVINYVNFVNRADGSDKLMIQEKEEDDNFEEITDDDAWNSRPIYQLTPLCISWKLPRSEAKALGKELSNMFRTSEPKVSKSKKPLHVKHGKSRRSGGYGIG